MSNYEEIEFVINCSMMEIYKENLYDLLSVGQTGLSKEKHI